MRKKVTLLAAALSFAAFFCCPIWHVFLLILTITFLWESEARNHPHGKPPKWPILPDPPDPPNFRIWACPKIFPTLSQHSPKSEQRKKQGISPLLHSISQISSNCLMTASYNFG